MPERIGLGERIGNAFARALRSWPFLLLFLAQWVWWWAANPPPGGWRHFLTHFSDPFPYVFQGNWEANLTMLDIILFGIVQLEQGKRQDAIARAQLESLRALQRQGEMLLRMQEQSKKD
jgi:hypothetical protein